MKVVLATCRKQPVPTDSDQVLIDELRARAVAVAFVPWDDLDPAQLHDVTVCLRATWDYHTRFDEFTAWIVGLREHGVSVVHPAETVLWNMDKFYLGSLEGRGIAIPGTRWIAPGDSIDLPAMLASAGWTRAVLKPRVSATAYGTHLVTATTVLSAEERRILSRHGALLQEFVPEIGTAGETSLVFLDGSFSHAVCKRPSPGDFRVQREFGGTAFASHAEQRVLEFGAAVLQATPCPWVYARVDLVDTARGPVLMELELIEPDLFLAPASDGVRRLAAALAKGA